MLTRLHHALPRDAHIDVVALQQLRVDKYLTMRSHPTSNLVIWNYTPRCQFERYWTPETMQCRGLITRPDGTIVARPFPKFFNLDEHIALFGSLPDEPFEVCEKLDGSLGILYHEDSGELAIATRGSFESEQALFATRFLRERYALDPTLLPVSVTLLFEIIYPSNRIVVDYGAREDLVLLAAIETETGYEVTPHELRQRLFPLARSYAGITDLAAIKGLGQANEEGFVVRFNPSRVRVKVKLDEYVRLHRLLTGINARDIWERLATGQSLDELLNLVPDEFYAWVQQTVATLETQYHVVEQECLGVLEQVKKLTTRREQAAIVTTFRYSGVVFRMLDEKPYAEAIWKQVRPTAERPFRIDNEG